jgi:hypothetical protein
MDSQTNKIMHTLKTECVEYGCVNQNKVTELIGTIQCIL